MVALSATSDELRKYPMVTERLTKFAGPQCFPHLNPNSSDFRVRANEPAEACSPDDGESARSWHGEALFDGRNWLQCCRCLKWRFAAPGCAAVFGSQNYFSVRGTDVDWESWLRGAEARYAQEVAKASAPREAERPGGAEASHGSGGWYGVRRRKSAKSQPAGGGGGGGLGRRRADQGAATQAGGGKQ